MEGTEYGDGETKFGWHEPHRAVRVEMLFGDDELARVDSFVWNKTRKSYQQEGIDKHRRYNLRNYMVREARRDRGFEKLCRKASFTIEWEHQEVTLCFDGRKKWRRRIGNTELQLCFGGVQLALLGQEAPAFISRVKV